jgi:glycylpeptide N-tetradecanoyltransferase
MSEESKLVGNKAAEAEEILDTVVESSVTSKNPTAEDAAEGAAEEQTADGKKKKKKSKASKIKNAIAGSSSSGDATGGLTPEQFQQLLAVNPALKAEAASMDPAKLQEMMKNISLSDILTGSVCSSDFETVCWVLILDFRLLLGETKKTWARTSFGRLNLSSPLVRNDRT